MAGETWTPVPEPGAADVADPAFPPAPAWVPRGNLRGPEGPPGPQGPPGPEPDLLDLTLLLENGMI